LKQVQGALAIQQVLVRQFPFANCMYQLLFVNYWGVLLTDELYARVIYEAINQQDELAVDNEQLVANLMTPIIESNKSLRPLCKLKARYKTSILDEYSIELTAIIDHLMTKFRKLAYQSNGGLNYCLR
jgi:hypothetical protein